MDIDKIMTILLNGGSAPHTKGTSTMKIKCIECGDFVRAELARILDTINSDLAYSHSTTLLNVPIWHMMVSRIQHGPEDVKAIEASLQKDFVTQEYRSVAYSRKKLLNILLTGIDVVPTTSIFYSGHLTKSLIYGGRPKIVMMLDSTKLKPTMINLGKDPKLADIMNVGETYPYVMKDRNGNYLASRNTVEQTRFGPEEHAYAHWIPCNAREALQGVLILDESLNYEDDELFNAHLCNLLKFDE